MFERFVIKCQSQFFFFTGTYITQDHESFSQSFTKQSDPFGKQLVQMFTEMLTHNHKVEEEVFQL